MRTTGSGPDGARLRALIVVLWRAGLRMRSTSPRPTLIDLAVPSSCAPGRAVGDARWAWTAGAGTS